MLLAYRRMFLRIFAEAPLGESPSLARDLANELARHGRAVVEQHGQYWKTPECLEFNVSLIPDRSVANCLADLRAEASAGWAADPGDGIVWVKELAGDQSFLLPSIRWASVDGVEAPFPPRFQAEDIVRIKNSPLGGEAVVCGRSPPDPDSQTWVYAVMPVGSDEVICFGETDLEPTWSLVRRAAGDAVAED